MAQVRLELATDPTDSDWLAVREETQVAGIDLRLGVRLSLAHPFMARFCQTDPQQLEALIHLSIALALSESLARRGGVSMAGAIRRNLNQILLELHGPITR